MSDIVGRSFSRVILSSLLAGLAAPLGAQLVWEPLAGECDASPRSILCPSEAWEDGCVWAPTILRDEEDGLYRMWYLDCNGESIGHAWSPDGLEWEKDPLNPVMTSAWLPTVLLETGDVKSALLTEEAVAAGRVFKMWYSWDGGIHYAESLDGSQWVQHGSHVLSTGLSGAWDDNWLRHLILVKVFEGIGQHAFRLRFQDQSLPPAPVLPGRIGLAGCEDPLPSFRRGDADVNGAVNITDAVRILNVLFLGLGAIACDDAADSDDNGAVNITDAVRVLNVLFLGLGVIPAPGMEMCGSDPTEDVLTACAYESC